jgi:hypothetical protein
MREREKVFIVALFTISNSSSSTWLSIFLCDLASNSRAFDDDLYQAAAEALFYLLSVNLIHTCADEFSNPSHIFCLSRRVASRTCAWERLFGADIYFYSSQQHRTFLANPLGN